MRVNIKEGVVFKEINEHYLCMFEALNLLPFSGYTATITSGNDSKHMISSKHYKNLALDIRCNDLSKDKWEVYLNCLKTRLGPEYDVVLEGESGANSHIHIEFDPHENRTN